MSRPQAVPPEAVRSSTARPESAEQAAPAPAAAPGTPIPHSMHLSELKSHHVSQLVEMATSNGIENASRLRKQDLIFAMLKNQA